MQRFIHMGMLYKCKDCGSKRVLFLEKGLEERCNKKLKNPSGLPHKPVPFGVICPVCGGFHMYHLFGNDMYFEEFVPVIAGMNLFMNTKKYDCGKPVFNYNGSD